MYIRQLYTNCLAEAAYYIESEGEAVVIDPLREPEPYIELARERGTKIKYVLETHFHADFVSGHLDLAAMTGAKIIYGPGAAPNYTVYNAKDNEEFSIGKCKIKALHTPGHTPESTCYLLTDETGKEHAVFTGDTLFVGDVGRPDLLDGILTKEDLAGMMYDSLNNKLKKLNDDVIVYPGHGAGSSCGKNIGKETWSTIGEQKKYNYALREMTRDEFIREITDGLVPPPAYFFEDARINKEGYDNIHDVIVRNLKALDVNAFEAEISNGAMVLDTRKAGDFEKGFVKGSLNIGLEGTFAVWLGTLVDINIPIVVVTETGKEKETVLRMARVGYENVRGYLDGGIEAWKNAGKEVDTVEAIEPERFAELVKQGRGKVLDVRKISEVESGHVRGALHITLSDLPSNINLLDTSQNYLIHCGGGYRSMIAASFLKSKGFKKLIDVHGGFAKIKNTGLPIETGTAVNAG